MARDLIIGLGTNCELTHNLRRAFGLEEAYPFDWWITPLPALASLIENGFDFAIEDDNLALTDNGMSVLNRRWRILHHHDFPRRDGRIRDDWRDVIPETARKYEALARRLDQRLGAATTATVFINGNGGHEYLTPDERFACSRPGLYEAVLAAARRRWPHVRLRPVICNPSPDAAPPCEAVVLRVEDHGDREPGKDFARSPRGWDEVLATLGLARLS